MNTDPLFIYFDALDALLCTEAAQRCSDAYEHRAFIGWAWFRLVTEPTYRNDCLARIGA